MADIIRSSKSDNDWADNDLLACNITIGFQSAIEIFGSKLTWAIFIQFASPAFLTLSAQPTYRFLSYLLPLLPLLSTTRVDARQESAIDDFAREILR